MTTVRVLKPFRERIDEILGSLKIERTADEGTVENKNGDSFRRVDFGFSGALDGYVALGGPIAKIAQDAYGWITDVPHTALPQEHITVADPSTEHTLPLQPGDGNTSPLVYVRGTFRADDGAGMTVFVPERAADWNGKLFLIQRGAGTFPSLQSLVERSDRDVFTRGLGRNTYLELMMDKGYAVAWFRKDAARPPEGVSVATAEDGTAIRTNHHCHVALLLAMAEFAQNAVAERMGRRPDRTYYLGHSSGGMSARLTNYAPRSNRARDGGPVIDAFINDDCGGGLYLPLAFEDGRNVLFQSEADKETFVPQIDLTRMLYNPASYLRTKRENARLLREKGLSHKHRYYEVRGVCHFDAGMAGTAGKLDSLDLGGLMEAIVDIVDDWVERGIEPPASRADLPGYAPPIALPEVAYPLGVYYQGPQGVTGRPVIMLSGFAAFDGMSPEPVSSVTRMFVDMNGNGVQDQRETVTQAWRRLGILGPEEEFTKERYVRAMRQAAADLINERLLPGRLEAWYETEAVRLLEAVEEAAAGEGRAARTETPTS
jgi:hypothetical protein